MNFKSARQIWHDAFHVEIGSADPMAPIGTREGNDNRIWSHVLKGKAQDVIARLPALEKSWGMYAYTDQFSRGDYERVLSYLLESTRNKGIKFSENRRLLNLLEALTLDFKTRVVRGDKMYTQAMLAKILEISPSNYVKQWGKVELSVKALLDGMDQRALAPVHRLIQEKE